ncbi:hypothetical protein PZ897_17865 [Hoeflea sp. YIM 152468]|nr:hypothetical protein [Hoeflea sp. YIM 152468]MDF1610051.1 hypothetical protein [Hoeflea sp. YIM 152468]
MTIWKTKHDAALPQIVLQDKKRLPGRFHAAIAGALNSRRA